MKKRIFCLFLCLLMLAPTACSDNTAAETEDETAETEASADVVTADTTEAVEETAEETIASNVPDNLDYNGESVTIYYYKCLDTYNIEQTELTGENVVDAIYNANMSVMDYLNCKFEYYNDDNIEVTNIVNSVNAGDDTYDICYATQWKVAPVLPKHYFKDFQDDQYVDFSYPWWYQDYMNETSTGNGQIYMLAGDLNLTILRRATEMLMNNTLLTDLNISSDDIKNTVLEGNWTFDELYNVCSNIYIDTNGNSEADRYDTYGIASWSKVNVEFLLIGSGVRATARDENNVPYLTFNSEITYTALEKICQLFNDNPGMFYIENDVDTVGMLAENRVGFLIIEFADLEEMRDVESDYTVIPIPKAEESVENYSSLVHDDTTIVCEPITCGNPELASAVIEQLCYEGYMNVLPEYYNVSLKNKYTRNMDDDNVRIIDTIHDNITTDFGYVYNYSLSNMITDLRYLICDSKSADFASYYQKKEKLINKTFSKLIASFDEE